MTEQHDLEFITRQDGSRAVVITYPGGPDRLGTDGAVIADWIDTLFWALDRLRSGAWDHPSPEAVKELYTAINDVDHRLLPRLEGIRDALIRAHYKAGGSHADLALAMDVPRSTAQSRADKVRNADPSAWEEWARNGGPECQTDPDNER